MMTGAYRHCVDVIGPVVNVSDRGAPQGEPPVLMRNVPCAITPLSGREGEIARQVVATATHRVEMRGPIPSLSTRCKLREIGNARQTATGPKPHIMEIGNIADPYRTGHQLTLLVTEEV